MPSKVYMGTPSGEHNDFFDAFQDSDVAVRQATQILSLIHI